jgi:hypothetical protein
MASEVKPVITPRIEHYKKLSLSSFSRAPLKRVVVKDTTAVQQH